MTPRRNAAGPRAKRRWITIGKDKYLEELLPQVQFHTHLRRCSRAAVTIRATDRVPPPRLCAFVSSSWTIPTLTPSARPSAHAAPHAVLCCPFRCLRTFAFCCSVVQSIGSSATVATVWSACGAASSGELCRDNCDFSDISDIEYPPFAVLDLTVGLRLTSRLRADAQVTNVTDENYGREARLRSAWPGATASTDDGALTIGNSV